MGKKGDRGRMIYEENPEFDLYSDEIQDLRTKTFYYHVRKKPKSGKRKPIKLSSVVLAAAFAPLIFQQLQKSGILKGNLFKI